MKLIGKVIFDTQYFVFSSIDIIVLIRTCGMWPLSMPEMQIILNINIKSHITEQ